MSDSPFPASSLISCASMFRKSSGFGTDPHELLHYLEVRMDREPQRSGRFGVMHLFVWSCG
ncbi:hypothetical protein HFN20_03895 [Paenibacillus dendritiformis]|uniref:hypothetical protein n=1 Tax=Paenibacillus dendritiformis TaxID=130049 RepID=UPI00143D1295|nr:hypothetical protein [Paenibacillus dendritiformis]NKI20385.1 hypothetical protein [Paenibacillus dendritiformis]NRF98267.1 hypothetical protein [Paenibacillus dendritiformis]